MNRRHRAIVLALSALLAGYALAACTQGGEAPAEPVAPAPQVTEAQPSEPAVAETPEPADEEPAPEPEPEPEPAEAAPPADLAERLPYVGLSESFIDATYLGTASTVTENVVYDRSGIWTKPDLTATQYRWEATNGSGDTVFAAYCSDGRVVKIQKWNTGKDYWPDVQGLPDLDAEGKPRFEQGSDPTPPDPTDYYESADEYADDAYWWFEEQGYDDPYEAAAEYWELNGY